MYFFKIQSLTGSSRTRSAIIGSMKYLTYPVAVN
jgi:hypothetical protein